MQNTKNIAILMSTYNGECYLSQQIDSILGQSCQDFTLYIRDDGSKDSTLNIAQSYATKYSNVVLFDSNENLGCTRSFLTLLLEVKSQYYMFCDQDDVWLKDKIKDTLECMKGIETWNLGKSLIVYTDLTAVDAELNMIYPSMWEYRGHFERLPHTFNYLCHFHDIDGCTMMLNYNAKLLITKEILETIPLFMYHDWLMALLVCKANGFIIPLEKSTMLFRRHGDNETNALESKRSIASSMKHIFPYIRVQYRRYLYFHSIGYRDVFTYFFYKFLYLLKRQLLKRR